MNHHGFFLFVYLIINQFQFIQTKEFNHKVSQQENQKQPIQKIKQLHLLIHDPDIKSLMKLNLETLQNEKVNLLQNWYSKQQIDTIISIKQTLNTWQQCPKKSPYFDGQNCISCQKQAQIFDLLTNMCTLCISGKIYDKKEKVCISRSNIFNIALTEMNPKAAEQIIIIRSTKIAGQLMSFIHEKTQLLKLRLNEDSNQKFSMEGAPNATNPHFLNLVVFSNNQKVSDYKLKNGDIPCPKQSPYFARDKCINCNYPTHLFDSKTKLCVKCSNNYSYSVKNHQCLKDAIQ